VDPVPDPLLFFGSAGNPKQIKIRTSRSKVKLPLCLNKHHYMKPCGRVHVQIHVLLTSALDTGRWSASRPYRFIPGTHWIGGKVDPTAGMGDVEKRKFLTLPGLELQPFGCRARGQSLYRLNYCGSKIRIGNVF
jgi:hypothetical protein